jgi:hypothetical protein
MLYKTVDFQAQNICHLYILCIFIFQPLNLFIMSGGIGHVLVMLANLKNNKAILKKRKSFKELKKNYNKYEIPTNIDVEDLTDAIKVHKAKSKKYERYINYQNFTLLLVILTFVTSLLYFLIIN